MSSSGPVGCVILASGLGQRFQTPGTPWRNKLLADFHGRPLICTVLTLTASLPLGPRTLVTRDPALADFCRGEGLDTVLHTLPYRSDSIRLGLQRVIQCSQEPLQGCLFCPGDQPLLERESLLALLDSFARAPQCIHRLAWQGTPGMPALFPAWTFPDLCALPQGAGGSFLMRNHPQRTVSVPVGHPLELEDVDTPQALARLAAGSSGT